MTGSLQLAGAGFAGTTTAHRDRPVFSGRPPWTVVALAAIGSLVLFMSTALPGVHGPTIAERVLATGHTPGATATFDAGDVATKAAHALTAVPGRPGTYAVEDAQYRATLGPEGLAYRPAAAGSALGLDLASIARGGTPLHLAKAAWHAALNSADRDVSERVQEQVTARAGHVDWDVVVRSRLPGRGDLVVGAALDGLAGAARVVAGGSALRLPLAGGSHVDLGRTVVVDATGAELFRALPSVSGGRLVIRIPDQVLERASYPMTVDPPVSSAFPVSTNGLDQDPRVAFDGTDYLVVWCENNGSTLDIFGAQVSGDGTAVKPLGAISSTTDGKAELVPEVAWNGSKYLVVWQRSYSDSDVDVSGRLVTGAGFFASGVLSISNRAGFQTSPAVTAAGSTFHVVWSDSNFGNGDIRRARVTNAGVMPDGSDGFAVTAETADDLGPAITTNGSGFLVSYDTVSTDNGLDFDTYAQRLNSSGAPVGAAIPLTAGTDTQDSETRVASDGTGYLVVWRRSNADLSGGDIRGARVTAAGAVTQIPISTAAATQTDPDVAFNGSYLVAWIDRRGDEDAYFGARVASDGTVRDPNGFLIDQSTTLRIFGPAVVRAPGGGDHWSVMYEEDLGNIYGRFVSSK